MAAKQSGKRYFTSSNLPLPPPLGAEKPRAKGSAGVRRKVSGKSFALNITLAARYLVHC